MNNDKPISMFVRVKDLDMETKKKKIEVTHLDFNQTIEFHIILIRKLK